MSTAQVKNLMAEMKLLGMVASFEKNLTDAMQDKWSYSEFLDVLLQAEADYRDERKSKARIKASKLKLRASFEDFDFTAKHPLWSFYFRNHLYEWIQSFIDAKIKDQ